MYIGPFVLAGLAGLAAAQQSLIQALNSTSELSNLTQIIQSSGLETTLANLSGVTILAPDNAAITTFLNQTTAGGVTVTQDLIQAILQYHIINGTYQNFSTNATFVPTYLTNTTYANITGGQVVEIQNTTVYSGLKANSSIVMSSVNFTGGIIHLIDRVLTVPESISQTATAFNLTSFYGAINATNTIATLDSLEDVTVFVPNNAAFQRVGSALPNLTQEQIMSILTYHVVNGTVAYSALLRNESIPTLQGNNVTITVNNATSVFVNNARVVIPDVLVANGVIHVIDEILNPANTTAANGTQSAGQPAFSGASSVTDEPYTSGQPTPTSAINTASIASSATGGSSSSSGGAFVPKPTAAIGVAALGGLALLMQL